MARQKRNPEAGHSKRSKYDWTTIRREYVEGITDEGQDLWWPTYKDLAERHNVASPHTVSARGGKEGWADERAAFRASLTKVRRKRRAVELAEDATKFDQQAVTLARTGMSLLGRRMGELTKQAKRASDAERLAYQNGDPDPLVPSRVSVAEIERIAKAASQWYDLVGRVYGEVDGDGRELLPGETYEDERTEARARLHATVTHEHSVTVETSTIEGVAEIIAGVEAEVARARLALPEGVLPDEDDPQDVEVIDTEREEKRA